MQQRTVLITGGSSGIGLETAKKFLGYGDSVVVLDRNPAPLDVPTIEVDLSDPESIAQAAAAAPEKIDVLCNVAGVAGTAGPRTVLAVNFLGARTLVEHLASRIAPGGAVVNVASTSGWYWRDHLEDVSKLIGSRDADEAVALLGIEPENGYIAYNRAKEAMVVWTILAAQHYFGKFRVNSVSPGPVRTPLLGDFYESMGADELDPLIAKSGRAGAPHEIADIIWYLASAESHWVNGTDIVADFGAEAFLALQDRAPQLFEQQPTT